jgi:hypothetical protein
LWHEADLEVKMELFKKCTRLWHEVKMLKHDTFGPLLELEMSKKCTPLWREANFEVKRVMVSVHPFEIGRGGRLKRIYKDAVRVAVQETCPSGMLGGQDR